MMSETIPKSKVCKKCGEDKPLGEFYKSRSCLHGVQARCKDCIKLQNREAYKENSHKWDKTRRAWREANVERIRENTRRYNDENRELIRKKQRKHRSENRELYRERQRARKVCPAKQRVYDNTRRARESGADGTCTPAQYLLKSEYHGNKCIYCGARDNLTVEHRIPLSRGGTNWPANLAPSCVSCNCSKGTRTETEFKQYLERINDEARE